MSEQGSFDFTCSTCDSKLTGHAAVKASGRATFTFTDGSRIVVRASDSGHEGDATKENIAAAKMIAEDIFFNEGNQFRYVARSAMHKEIRRGNARRAALWARLCSTLEGKSKTKQYLKNIVLEETRNLSLVREFESLAGKSDEVMASSLAASRKKWENPVSVKHDLWRTYCRGYIKARHLDTPPSLAEIEKAVVSNDPAEVYTMLWRCRIAGESHVSMFWSVGFLELQRRADPDVDAVHMRKNDSYYVNTLLAEKLVGQWDPISNDIDPKKLKEGLLFDVTEMEIPPLPAYVYDKHTRPGRRLLTRHLAEHRAGQPQPGGLDLRWAGTVRGTCWRFHAYAQFGEAYIDTPWEAVSIAPEIWHASVSMEAIYAEDLYRAARVTTDHRRLLAGDY